MTLDTNNQYRKFKTNMSLSKGNKIDRSKVLKSEKHKVIEKKSGGSSYSQTPSKSHVRKSSKTHSLKHDPHPYNYSPHKPDSVKVAREREVSDLEDDQELADEGAFEYYFGSDPKLPEIQSKISVKKNLQLQGDKSISISKETEENIRQSEARPLTITPDNISSKFILSKPSSSLNNPNSEGNGEIIYIKPKLKKEEEPEMKPVQEPAPTTKIVQIDCHSLDPLDTTKSKDELISEIQNIIIETGKEPDTKSKFYRVGKLLGRGAFGKVSLGMHKATNQLVAMKSINKEFLEEERSRKKVAREVAILKKLQHQNIINLYETFETEKHFLLVTELCPGGDLLNYVRRRRKLTEEAAKYFFKQLVEACIYCHKKGVVHRDIKLDNILLDQRGCLKLGDFGVSRAIKKNEILKDQ